MTSPVFRPQVRAGVLPSGSFTTTMPLENSFTPTVWPTGTRRFPPVSAARAAVAHSTRASASAAPKRTPFWMFPCKLLTPFAVSTAFSKQIVDFIFDIPICIEPLPCFRRLCPQFCGHSYLLRLTRGNTRQKAAAAPAKICQVPGFEQKKADAGSFLRLLANFTICKLNPDVQKF